MLVHKAGEREKSLFFFLFQDKLPLAVVGSNTIMEVNNKKVRVRQYPWGVAEGISPSLHA